jgi:hypothetical protein
VALAIVDEDLDGEAAVSFADRFHARYPPVPVILVASLQTERLEHEVRARTFVTLFCKPVNYEELHKAILQLTAG